MNYDTTHGHYDPVRGKTIQWSFDGPLAGKMFEHVFGQDGTVTYRTIDGESKKPSTAVAYRIATITTTVCALSYLGESGYTLTAILDFNSNHLVAFASNEKELSQHNGAFTVIGDRGDLPLQPRPTVREFRDLH